MSMTETNEQLVELIKQGRSDLMEALYVKNRGFIYRLIKPYQKGISEIDDLMQTAYLGLARAVKKYNPEHNCKFLTFAQFHIVGEVRREACKLKGVPERVYLLIRHDI